MCADGEAAVLSVLVEGAGRLLRGVASGNLGAFARLFCAAVLQAAATGEALLDSELGALAARDPSRFSRLNQRLQVCAAHSKGDSVNISTCTQLSRKGTMLQSCRKVVVGLLHVCAN